MFPWSKKKTPSKPAPQAVDAADIDAAYVSRVMDDLELTTYASAMIAGGAPCIRFKLGDAVPAGMPIRGMRLGGAPDLPSHIAWPVDQEEGQPMPFAAWLDLAALASVLPIEVLPSTGCLAIFIDFEDYDGAVIYVEESAPARSLPPGATTQQYAAHELRPQQALSFPEDLVDVAGIDATAGADLDDLIVPLEPCLQVGGFPVDARAKKDGKNTYDGMFLLMQIPTNDDFGGDEWADGAINVWISPDDLESRNFSEAQFDFQIL